MQRIANRNGAAVVALAIIAIVWGYNWVVMKVAVHDASPFVFGAWRTLGGACALLCGAVLARKSLRPLRLGMYVWIGVFQTGMFIALITWAIVRSGAGQVAMLSYTMPLWVGLLAWPLLGERLSRSQAAAIAIAFLGVACMIGPLNHGALPSLLALSAGVAWAIGVILTKRVQRDREVDLYSLTMWQMLAGGIVLLALALFVPERPTVWSGTFILALLYNIFLATALAYVLWTFALSKLPARTASMATLTSPIFGTLAAWVLLHEVPSTLDGIGMGLVAVGLAALALVEWKSAL